MNWIKLKTRRAGATLPTRGYIDDAGLDLYCLDTTIIWPFGTADLDTGYDVNIPERHWGTIKARSSTWKRRRLIVFEGVIDPGYTGQLSILVWNPAPWPKIVKRGERLAQLIIHINTHSIPLEVEYMPTTSRGRKGFGSTDER